MADKSPWLIGFGLLLIVSFAAFAMSPWGGSHDGNIVWAVVAIIGLAIGAISREIAVAVLRQIMKTRGGG